MYAHFCKGYYGYEYLEPSLTVTSFLHNGPFIIIDCSRQNELVKSATVDVRLEFETKENIPMNTTAYCLIIHRVVQYNPLTNVFRQIAHHGRVNVRRPARFRRQFVVKEFAVLREQTFLSHYIFTSPVPRHFLASADKSGARWVIRHHHRLRWDDRTIPYNKTKSLITKAVHGTMMTTTTTMLLYMSRDTTMVVEFASG
ncbi:hypothetical protein P5V15_002661 [Pogonomyrmex californicus]